MSPSFHLSWVCTTRFRLRLFYLALWGKKRGKVEPAMNLKGVCVLRKEKGGSKRRHSVLTFVKRRKTVSRKLLGQDGNRLKKIKKKVLFYTLHLPSE